LSYFYHRSAVEAGRLVDLSGGGESGESSASHRGKDAPETGEKRFTALAAGGNSELTAFQFPPDRENVCDASAASSLSKSTSFSS
jgi:hypothetical protein